MTSARPEPVVVSVVGRVRQPGLVTLRPGARVANAVEAAGGTLPRADIATINLARKVVDGEQLYVAVPVPAEVRQPAAASDARAGSSEGATSSGGGSSGAAGTSGPANSGDDKIDLNTASKEQLHSLPGVGESTVDKILRWRQEHGRFTSTDQLTEVGGIGDARLSRIRDRVRV